MLDTLAVVGAILALEAARIGWHGRAQGAWWLVALHAGLAAWLGWTGGWWSASARIVVPLLAVLAVLVSRLALDSKRRNEPWGVAWSGLSSLPWEGLALASLGWWGLPAAVLAGWLSVGVWMSPLRPVEWTASRWAKRLGWMHPWW